MTRILRYVNVPYMDSTIQQSGSPSAPQPTTTSALAIGQQSPNHMVQQAHQMASAGRPMTPTTPQPTAATSPTNMVSHQQMPAVGQLIDWTSKIAEVMREQFGLRSKE
jgi:hypothetical protein